MPKQSPIPDEVDAPFWAACNEDRLVLQFCGGCGRYQHPPSADCRQCGSTSSLGWRQVDGGGTIYSYTVVYDTPIALLQSETPFNVVTIDIDEAPGVNMVSHLPGTPVDRVPIGASVRLIFEVTEATGQKVPEWRVVDN
jgi:uncharacterized OB-fold protein